jgi:hypothetical protein
VEQGLSWAVNSKYSCFNEIGDCLPYSLTKAYREIEMQVHAFLIAAIGVCEWLISHPRVSICGGRVNGIEINSSPVLVMNTTNPNLISQRIHGRSHKLSYHTRVIYSSYLNIFGTQGVKCRVQHCVYFLSIFLSLVWYDF